MKSVLLTIAMFITASAFSQGAVIVKRNKECPENQWFMFPGRSHYGVYVFTASPDAVKEEVLRLMEYYKADKRSYVDSEDETKYEIELSNGYKVFIQVTEIDKLEWRRNIYLMVR